MFIFLMQEIEPTRLDFALDIDFSAILTNPILDIAARVWEQDRYDAFQVCYRSMRRVDDLVDNLKIGHGSVPGALAGLAEAEISGWLARARSNNLDDDYGRQFLLTLDRYAMPLWPWERLGKAMIYDLRHRGFATFHSFLRYSEGAAISPAAVFMHLCGVRKTETGYAVPEYDIRLAARPLAVFSYLVHIMRDYEKDQKAGLNYFADTILAQAGLTVEQVRDLAHNGQIDTRLRALMSLYHTIASRYQAVARQMVDRTLPYLDNRYQLSLELIYTLYSQIFEKVDPERGAFSAGDLNPSSEEVNQRVLLTINRFRPTPRIAPTGSRSDS